MSADKVYELVNLAERYDLPKFKAKLKQELETIEGKQSFVDNGTNELEDVVRVCLLMYLTDPM